MNLSNPLCAILADELTQCGITEAVISPGLHSGLLASAFYGHPDLRLHVRIDERSAAFLALGLARASGRPAAVACTSGTAAANFYPAILEARHARVPLLVITTDRQPRLRGIGANQTTDQVKMYGSAVQSFAELESTAPDGTAPAYWRSAVARAVASTAGGPAHLNLMLPDPLAPVASGSADAGSSRRAPHIQVSRSAPEPQSLDVPGRGVVVVGDGAADPDAAVAFAEQAGWPLLAEPQSGARHGSHAITTYGYLLSHPGFRSRAHPETLISVGRPGVNLALLDYLGSVRDHIVVDPAADWADPARTATRVISRLGPPSQVSPDPDWLRLWRDADKAALDALDHALDQAGVTEPRIARDLTAALPPGSLLFAASSMPVRDVERTMRPRRDLRVLANRGLSGIDGAVSSAIGAAIAHQAHGPARAYALLGDLSLLHDQNGLITGPAPARPDIALIVVNNNGGGIFSMLPQEEPIDGFETFFGTPHDVSIAEIAAASHWPYRRAETMAELLGALDEPCPRIVEVVTDRHENARFHRALAAAVGAAIDEVI
jgi:2-succinyl-5-enolpyruvyl-6-hydroxy-3-cyclohexene-1-carboxylate synthase